MTTFEKLIMRFSERKDIFAEKFPLIVPRDTQPCSTCGSAHEVTNACDRLPSTSGGSIPSFEEGLFMRNGEQTRSKGREKLQEGDAKGLIE